VRRVIQEPFATALRFITQPTIFEILPVHPFSEQPPNTLFRPFFIVPDCESLIGPYVLHFKQNPLYAVICCRHPETLYQAFVVFLNIFSIYSHQTLLRILLLDTLGLIV
jgi:hypothetical protein